MLVTYENNQTIPTEIPPISIPSKNLLRFHGVSRSFDTLYPQRYTGSNATKNAMNDNKSILIIIFFFYNVMQYLEMSKSFQRTRFF